MLLTRVLRRQALTVPISFGLALLGSTCVGSSQTLAERTPTIKAVDETALVTLKGNTHPLAVAKYDQGKVVDSLALEHMYLVLRRTPEQEEALTKVLDGLQAQKSATYHHWLTANELAKYGPDKEDIATISRWLESHGMRVNGVSKSGLALDVSGNAGQVRDAFHTEIHNYSVKGKQYIANASDPQIPAALEPLVAGFNSLNSFLPQPMLRKPSENFTFSFGSYGEQYDEAPADLAKIYNAAPLYTAKTPITGKGVTVVVLENTDINSADVATFRKAFGLSSYTGTFEQIHPGSGCGDPGKNGAEGEAALDAEWAGGVAPDATVQLASCASTTTNFGPFIAAQNLLDAATPPAVMSLSYAECEASVGPSGNLYVAELWEQAALEGVSVFVSAGDGGSAGCDDFDTQTYSIGGIAANGLGSTPFNTATGGTDFLDTAEGKDSTYWSTHNSANGESAKSYVPEMTWNDSCASSVLYEYYGYTNPVTFCNAETYFLDIVAGSGAPSFVYAKPTWQRNVYGNPADGVRDLPDVSLFASSGFWGHAILFCMSDHAEGGVPCDYNNHTDALYNSAGGTSFTAPQFASIQALIDQKAGGPQGNAAPIYYGLGKSQYGETTSPNSAALSTCNAAVGGDVSSPCTFHDVTVGTNNSPCYGTNNCYGSAGLDYGVLSVSDSKLEPAYAAGSGWDFTTGLGTVNILNVVNRWP